MTQNSEFAEHRSVTPRNENRFMRNSRVLAALVALASLVFSLVAQPASASSNGSKPASVSTSLTGPIEITVRWAQPPGAVTSAYEVSMVEGGNKVAVMTSASTTFAFGGLTAGRWYSFRVRAIIGGKKGPYSATTSPVYVLKAGETAPPNTWPNALNAPSSLSATVVDRSVSLSWTPPFLGSGQKISNYVVTATPGPIVLTVSSSSLSAGFADLKPGVAYTFTVQATFSDGRRSSVINSAPIIVGPTTTTAAPTTTTTTTTTLPPTTTTTTTTTTLQPLPAVPALPAIPVSKCISQVWPSSAMGRPQAFGAGAKRGVYVWFESGVWNVHAYNPSNSPVLFTGSVTSNSSHKIYPTYTETNTDLIKAGRTTSSFSMSTTGDIDAFRLASPCSRTVTFSFLVNGQPMPTSEIFFGASGAHPLTSKFVLTR